MSVENNLYLRAMNKDQTMLMLKSSLYSDPSAYTNTPNLSESFEKAYKANYTFTGWLGRAVCAIPLAFYDVTIRSVCRLFSAFLYFIVSCTVGLCSADFPFDHFKKQLHHIGKNFEIAGGRLCSMLWNDQKGLEIMHRALLDKRCPIRGFLPRNLEKQFYYECTLNQLHNLHNAESSSLENALFYFEQIINSNHHKKRDLAEKFMNKLFDEKIFANYQNNINRLLRAYRILIEFMYRDFNVDLFFDIKNQKGVEQKSLFKILRNNIMHYHTKEVEGHKDSKAARKTLSDLYITIQSKNESIANVFLAHEYLLQGKEEKLRKVLGETPEALYFLGKFKEEIIFKLLTQKPELFSALFFEEKKILTGNWYSDKGDVYIERRTSDFCIGDLATNKEFITFLLITNPKLLELDVTNCKNQVVKDIFQKKEYIEEIIRNIEKAQATDSRLQFFRGIENLVDDPENTVDKYFKKKWFVEGVAKINKEIYLKLYPEELKTILPLNALREKSVLLSKACVTSKIKLPKPIRKDIAFRVANLY